MIENAELQGLVDFDCVRYGDPLFWMALTWTAIVSDIGQAGAFYLLELKRFLGMTAHDEVIFALYSALIGIDFYQRISTHEEPECTSRMMNPVEASLILADVD